MSSEAAAITRESNRHGRSRLLLAVGGGLVVMSVILAASGASRAVAAWVTPLAVALLGAGTWGLWSGRPLPRWVVVVLAVAVAALAVLGLWTLVYSLTHQPQAV